MENFYNPEIIKCCNCNEKTFLRHSEATYWKKIELKFVSCANCGLIFANPMPNLKAIIEGNKSINKHLSSRGTLTRYRLGKEFSYELLKYKSKGILLDLGCAEGFFLLGINENSNWKAEGIDIVENVVRIGRKELGLSIYLGTLEEVEDIDGRFDFIRAKDILEHVQNPITSLQKANKLLKKSGIIYCSVPNGVQDGFFMKTANKRGIKFNLLENHFYYYPPKTLSNIFKSCGFKILKSYCTDISHTINDFGLSPRFKYPKDIQNFSFDTFKDKPDPQYMQDQDFKNFRSAPSVNSWRFFVRRMNNKFLKLRIPSFFNIGHRLHIYAEKL